MVKPLVILALLLQFGYALPADVHCGGTEIALGYGDVLISIPKGWQIGKGKVYLELVSYTLKRPESNESAVEIVLSASTTHEDLGPGARAYCTNGLSGRSVDRDGMRSIRLDLPAPADQRPYDSKAIFRFSSTDKDAQTIVASTHLKGISGQCSS